MDIDICICTFRRAHVADTLRSLSQLVLPPGWAIRVTVADNDDSPSARDLVEATAQECGLAGTYIHAPARNISVARNACLDRATAPLIAFIDDDEIATPAWLNALVTVSESTKADVVLGPVVAVYGPECPEWMRKGDFHSTKPTWTDGEIRSGYVGNVLLRRMAPAIHGLRFRPELGISGGEDTAFFTEVYKAGGKISYAPEAVATETVTPERARFSWLLKRYFRRGQTHGLLLLEEQGGQLPVRFKNIALAYAKALFCFLAACIRITSAARWRYWFLRGTMHTGVVFRLLGKRELQQYG